MKIDIMTLFPKMCESVLNESVIGRGRKAGKFTVNCTDIREYADNKHNKVDDTTFGGGMGMVMAAQPIYNCYKHICEQNEGKPYVIYVSPKGTVFNQEKAIELSKKEHIVILCGHYEGVDERVIEEIVDEEISIGDFVLTGGELPALVIADTILRMLPGVLSENICFEEESHFEGLLEYPQYTKPSVWRDKEVPAVLLSGNHAEIKKWRRKQSLLVTKERRPDMFGKIKLSRQDEKLINGDK